MHTLSQQAVVQGTVLENVLDRSLEVAPQDEDDYLVNQEWHLVHEVDADRMPWLALNSRDGRTRCDMTIHLKRNPFVYLIKQASLDILIVITGLGAMNLNPALPPFFGARTSILMTSMLMTINKSVRKDLGFGRLGYMIVLDWFAIFDVSILLLAITLTINIHLIVQKGSITLARRLDLVWTRAIYLLYAIGLSAFLVHFAVSGDHDVTIAYSVTMFGAFIGSVVTYTQVTTWRRHQKLLKISHEMLDASSSAEFLQRMEPIEGVRDTRLTEAELLVSDEHARHVMIENIFYEMDLESTGYLDREEVSALFRVLHRRAPYTVATVRRGAAPLRV